MKRLSAFILLFLFLINTATAGVNITSSDTNTTSPTFKGVNITSSDTKSTDTKATNTSFKDVFVYSEQNKFGLKSKDGTIITKAEYKKLIKLGQNSWIMQYGNKYGIVDNAGQVLIEPEFNQAERVLGKLAKFRKGSRYGIFDEYGTEILPVEYSSIDLLYGGMFVTSKNYKFGITDLNGIVILENIFDDIYMPNFNTLVIVYNGNVLEIERSKDGLALPLEIQAINSDLTEMSFSDITSSPIVSTGYYGVTATDYVLKLLSSISPAYEQTIDELMFSQGADTVSVLMRLSWLPKFPFVYAKKYFENIIDPYNGPLSKFKKKIKGKIKN